MAASARMATAAGADVDRRLLAAGADVDRRLLAAVAEGDGVSLAVLLARHEPDLARAARRWTGDPHLADEVVADVRLAVWQHAGRYQPTGAVRAWLFGIARNKARQLLRTRIRRLQHERAEDLAVDPPAGAAADPAEVLLGYPRTSALGRAFDALPTRLREPLQLLFDQNLGYADIATVLDLPVGTVKRRVFEARALLHEARTDA